MTRFLHITDLHITAPETDDPTRQTDTVAALDRLIAALQGLEPKPAFLVASGDLTNIGDDASYALLAERFAALDIPVVMTLGNHDRRAGWHAAFPGHPAAPEGPVDQDTVLDGVHIIALDSSVPGKVSGALSDAQLSELEATLARHAGLPKIVAIHHPPRLDPEGDAPWATLDDATTERLAALFAKHPVRAVLCGHVHMNRMGLWDGTPLVVTMGQQSTVDLTRSDVLSVICGTGFAICDLRPTGLQVTYVPLEAPEVIKEISRERLLAFS
ncbi:MAG: metallophosphoesterase [Pseudomonadota bacterium]